MGKEISTEAITCLQNSKVDGLIVRLPEGQLDRRVYVEVKDRLELIGGKWKGGKVAGFAFPQDPTQLLADVAGGTRRDLKKEFQFFGTPAPLCDELVRLAEIKDGMRALEPSAGQGAIIQAIYRAFPRIMQGPHDAPCVTVDYLELMPLNAEIISRWLNGSPAFSSRTSNMGEDFLAFQPSAAYDRIVANPPFSKNQDIDHITKMYACLKPGGRLVTIASKHWQQSTGKKEQQFAAWLESVNAKVQDVPAGAFKESGTNVASCIITINR